MSIARLTELAELEYINKSTSAVNKFGYNADIDTAAAEHIWSVGGLYPFSTFATAQSLEVLSISAEDGAGTETGAGEISINGLDANLVVQNATITMNGTTVVAIPGTWLAVNRAFINDGSTGSTGSNVGNINIRVASAGAIVSQMPATKGQTQQAIYRVPSGNIRFRVTKLEAYMSAITTKTATIEFTSVGYDCVTTRVLSSAPISNSIRFNREYHVGGATFASGSWAAFRATTAQNDTYITAEFDGVLE